MLVSGFGDRSQTVSQYRFSGMGAEELLRAIAAGDAPRVQAIPGIGRKTAERIALSSKTVPPLFRRCCNTALCDQRNGTERAMEDTLSALINLGYSAKMARARHGKAKMRVKDKTLEGLIKESLKILA